MKTFREIENQSDNEIIALINAGLHGHNDAWSELGQRDQALFVCLAADTERKLDVGAFFDLDSIPVAYTELEELRAKGQSMLDNNIDDCRSFRPMESSISLSDSEDLREFLLNQDLSDAVQLVEALGQLDDVAEEENRIAYNQMMRDTL